VVLVLLLLLLLLRLQFELEFQLELELVWVSHMLCMQEIKPVKTVIEFS
jgi:hypothetical protein